MKKLFSFTIIMILCFGLVGCGNKSDRSDKIISGLENVTTFRKDEDMYLFQNNKNIKTENTILKGWKLIYTPENEFVRFTNISINQCFEVIFGENCISNDTDSFTYDLSKNEVRFYFDSDIIEDIDIINYNIEDDEFSINSNGEEYYVSDDFLEFAKRYDIVNTIKKDIDGFKNELKSSDISLEDVMSLNYKDIGNYFK